MVGSRRFAPAPAAADRGPVRPRLRSPNLRPIQPLLPASAARQPPEVVGHRTRLLAARPRSEPQPAARRRPPVRPAPPGWHHAAPADRPVLEPRRHQPLRPARPLRTARARQFAAPAGQALASGTASPSSRHAAGTQPDPCGRRHRRPSERWPQTIQLAAPQTIDLTGQTDFDQLVSLARGARVAIGNDTGPMHLIAATNCASVVLFSRNSDPHLCAPRGPSVRVIQRADLRDLEAEPVMGAAMTMMSHAAGALFA